MFMWINGILDRLIYIERERKGTFEIGTFLLKKC